jgi:hypothetical protein
LARRSGQQGDRAGARHESGRGRRRPTVLLDARPRRRAPHTGARARARDPSSTGDDVHASCRRLAAAFFWSVQQYGHGSPEGTGHRGRAGQVTCRGPFAASRVAPALFRRTRGGGGQTYATRSCRSYCMLFLFCSGVWRQTVEERASILMGDSIQRPQLSRAVCLV